jgi:hypothetical protein
VADVNDLRQLPLADEEPSDPFDGALRRRETDARRPPVTQRLEPFQREREVGAALVAGDGVDLVDDHRLGGAQRLATSRTSHKEIERLRCGDHEAGRPADHRRALRARGVSRAHGDADLGGVEPELGGDVGDLGERLLEVLADVDCQCLQRRDVHDTRPGRDVETAVVVAVQPVDRDEKGGERLSRSGRRRDQRVGAGCDVRPTLGLRLSRALGEAAPEPLGHGRMEAVDGEALTPLADRGRELRCGQLGHLAHCAARV